MRIPFLLLGMLLMCSLAAFPVIAQDEDPVEGETPEFTLGDDQAVSVEGGDDDGTLREAKDIQSEAAYSKAWYIIIRGKLVGVIWRGRVLVIICKPARKICAVIRVRPIYSAAAAIP